MRESSKRVYTFSHIPGVPYHPFLYTYNLLTLFLFTHIAVIQPPPFPTLSLAVMSYVTVFMKSLERVSGRPLTVAEKVSRVHQLTIAHKHTQCFCLPSHAPLEGPAVILYASWKRKTYDLTATFNNKSFPASRVASIHVAAARKAAQEHEPRHDQDAALQGREAEGISCITKHCCSLIHIGMCDVPLFL